MVMYLGTTEIKIFLKDYETVWFLGCKTIFFQNPKQKTFFKSLQSLCMFLHLCVFLCAQCVHVSCRAVCYEVIVSCRGSSMVKVRQVGSCQMAVHPLLGRGPQLPPVGARGDEREVSGCLRTTCAMLSWPRPWHPDQQCWVASCLL